MMKPTIDVEGIVLSVQDYKESDGIIKLLTKDGIISVLAKGIQKQASKNRAITQVFSKVKYTIDERKNGISLLYYGQTIKYYYRILEDLTTSSICFVLSECINKSRCDENVYYYFDKCLESFQLGLIDAYSYGCLVLKELISLEGVDPFVDGCIICQRKDHLETLSLDDGGFICTRCNHDRTLPRSKNEMIQIRSLFKVKIQDIDLFTSMYEFSLDDFIYWAEWLEKYTHIKIMSLDFLKAI